MVSSLGYLGTSLFVCIHYCWRRCGSYQSCCLLGELELSTPTLRGAPAPHRAAAAASQRSRRGGHHRGAFHAGAVLPSRLLAD